MTRHLTVCLFLAFTAMLLGQNAAEDYPQWRGRNRDGAASAFVEPKTWPDTLTRRWKVSIGEGYATPLVIGATAYAFTRRDGEEIMTALSVATGTRQWETRYPAPYTVSPPTSAHGAGPKSTPLYHDGRLFTLGISGIVTAFDAASGKRLWQTPAPAEHPYYSTAVSPVAERDLVMVHPGNYGPLTAFDAASGEIKWTSNGDGAYASPIVADLAGVRQVITVTQQDVAGVSLADGTVLWRHPSKSDVNAITPILHGDAVIIGGRQGVAAIRPARRGGAWSVEVVWEASEVTLFMSNPVVVGDTVFGLSSRAAGQFFGLDAGTGKVLWLGAPRQATNTAVVKAGDVLFLLNDDGELVVAKSSRAGFEPLKRYKVADGATWAQPAISANRIFVKDVSSLALWTVD